jgi:hypothetical protein
MLGEVQEAIAIRVKVTECRCHMLTVGGDHALTLDNTAIAVADVNYVLWHACVLSPPAGDQWSRPLSAVDATIAERLTVTIHFPVTWAA